MIVTIVLACAAIAFLLLAQHPFITYPISLWLWNRMVGAPPFSKSEPLYAATHFAVCVCAYNEEKVIEAKIQNLLDIKARHPQTELLVYVDASSDRTAVLLEPYQDRIQVYVAEERHGKTHGMNLLARRATAPVLVFTDANVMLDVEALDNLSRHFADPTVGCVCGNLIYTNGDDSVTAQSGSLYWRLEQAIKELEQLSGSVMGADGSLFAIRRELHHPPPDHLIDDMYVSFRILCDGFRVVQANDVLAFEKSGTVALEEFRRKVRIACQAFNVHRVLWPLIRALDPLTVYKYVSHKLLRWFSIYFVVLGALCIELALLSAGAWQWALSLALIAGAALWLGQRWMLKPFVQLTDILLSLAGAGLGVWKSLRGTQYQTWAPSQSVRDAP